MGMLHKNKVKRSTEGDEVNALFQTALQNGQVEEMYAYLIAEQREAQLLKMLTDALDFAITHHQQIDELQQLPGLEVHPFNLLTLSLNKLNEVKNSRAKIGVYSAFIERLLSDHYQQHPAELGLEASNTILNEIIDSFYKLDDETKLILFEDVIDRNNLQMIEKLIDRAARIKNYLVFRLAVEQGKVDVVKYLIEIVNERTRREMLAEDNYSALGDAASNDQIPIVKELIKVGNVLGITSDMLKGGGYLAFIVAASNGNIEMIEELLTQANKFGLRDEMLRADQFLAFHYTAENNHLEAMELLLFEASLNSINLNQSKYGDLKESIKVGNLDLAIGSLRSVGYGGFESTLNSKRGEFSNGNKSKRIEIIHQFLIEQSSFKELKVVKEMLKSNSEEDEYLAFKKAAEQGNLEIVKRLVKWTDFFDATKSMISADDYFSFSIAAEKGHIEVVKFLYDTGERLNLLPEMFSANVYDAFYIAAEKEHINVLDFLWNNCPSDDKKPMLQVNNYEVFRSAIENGNRQEVLEYIWNKASDHQLIDEVKKEIRESLIHSLKSQDKEKYRDMLSWIKNEIGDTDPYWYSLLLECQNLLGSRRRNRRSDCSTLPRGAVSTDEAFSVVLQKIDNDLEALKQEIQKTHSNLLEKFIDLKIGNLNNLVSYIDSLKRDSEWTITKFSSPYNVEGEINFLLMSHHEDNEESYRNQIEELKRKNYDIEVIKPALIEQAEDIKKFIIEEIEPIVSDLQQLNYIIRSIKRNGIDNVEITKHLIQEGKKLASSVTNNTNKIKSSSEMLADKIKNEIRNNSNLLKEWERNISVMCGTSGSFRAKREVSRCLLPNNLESRNLKKQQEELKTLSSTLKGSLSSENGLDYKIQTVKRGPFFSIAFRDSARITYYFSYSFAIKKEQIFLNNLKNAAEISDSITQAKMISEQERVKIVQFYHIVNDFQSSSPKSSVPRDLRHLSSEKTIPDLINYIRTKEENTAFHIAIGDRLIAIYCRDNSFLYFDSKNYLVTNINLESISKILSSITVQEEDRTLVQVEELDLREIKRDLEETLTGEDSKIFSEEFKTERNSLLGQDISDPIVIYGGTIVRRTMLYDLETKVFLQEETPALINHNIGQRLNSGNFIEYVRAGKIKISATSFLKEIRSLPNCKELAKTVKGILADTGNVGNVFISDITDLLEEIREISTYLFSSENTKLKDYKLRKLLENKSERPIVPDKAANKLIGTANLGQFGWGTYGTLISCRRGHVTDCATNLGEIGFSFISPMIEKRIIERTPKFVTRLKYSGKLMKGFAGIITSPFDIYDLVSSSVDAINAKEGSRERRDNIVSATFSGSSFVSSIAFAMLGKPGIGTAVGVSLIMGHAVYNGFSTLNEYEKNYQLTYAQKANIFFNTIILQDPSQRVQDDVRKQEVIRNYIQNAWQIVQNNSDIVGWVISFGDISFRKEYRTHVINSLSNLNVNLRLLENYDFSSSKGDPFLKGEDVPIGPVLPSNGLPNQARLFCFSIIKGSDKDYCSIAAVLDYSRMASAKKIITNLINIESGNVTGSNRWQNEFLIFDGAVKLQGGRNTVNKFTLHNNTFSGEILGKISSFDILDASRIDSESIYYLDNIQGRKTLNMYRGNNAYSLLNMGDIDYFIGREGKKDRADCMGESKTIIDTRGGNDTISDCPRAIITGGVNVYNQAGNYTYYVQPTAGNSVINSTYRGTIVFPQTGLLAECQDVTYSFEKNSLFFKIPAENGNFTLEIQNYLNRNETDYSYNAVLLDKHNSVIEPLIAIMSSNSSGGKVKLFNLKSSGNLTYNEAFLWSKNVTKNQNGYRVYTVFHNQRENETMIFGSDDSDIIPLDNIAYTRGQNGEDIYRTASCNIAARINNYAEDEKFDILVIDSSAIIVTSQDRLDLIINFFNQNESSIINVTNYFLENKYRHLMIVDSNKRTLIPSIRGEVKLLPFYRATKNQFSFSISAEELIKNNEIVIDDNFNNTSLYRDHDDLLMVGSFILRLQEFYANLVWKNASLYFLQNDFKVEGQEMSEFAEAAINYSKAAKRSTKQYNMEALSKVHHNSSLLGEGILVFDHILPNKINITTNNNDLLFSYNQFNTTHSVRVKNWRDRKNRPSTIRFNLEPKVVEINNLKEIKLSDTERILRSLLDKVTFTNVADQKLKKLKPEVVDGIRYLLSIYETESNIKSFRILNFRSMKDQTSFISAYQSHYTQEVIIKNVLEDQQLGEALVWLMVKGYMNLFLDGNIRNNQFLLHQCFDSLSKYLTRRIIREVESHSSVSEIEKIAKHSVRFLNIDSLVEEVTSVTHRNRRGIERDEFFDAENNAIYIMRAKSAESKPSSLINDIVNGIINSLFSWTKGFIGGLFNSKAALAIELGSSTTKDLPNVSQNGTQVDVDGTIMLLDLLIRKVTGQKYISTENQPVSILEARAHALNITEKFNQILKETAIKSGISVINLNFDPIELQSTVYVKILNNRSDQLSKALYKAAEEACPYFKQKDSFIDSVKNHLSDKNLFSTLQGSTKASSELKGKSNHNLPLHGARPRSCLSNVTINNSSIKLIEGKKMFANSRIS